MKMKKLTFLLLSVLSATAFADSYVDSGAENNPKDNKESEAHFYMDIGMNAYNFDQPKMNLPMSVGYGDSMYYVPTTQGDTFNDKAWNLNPTITLGYEFLTDNEVLQQVFGQQNAIEIRASYFHGTGTDNEQYGSADEAYYVNPWFIIGQPTAFIDGGSYAMTGSIVNFDTTYTDIGLYYTGNKVISNALINSPYVGIDFSYLKQDSDYTADLYTIDGITLLPVDPAFPTAGSDDLSSYYIGLAFGDKATWLLAKHYGVYGELGGGIYLIHTSLSASQTPTTNDNQEDMINPALQTTYTVDARDNRITFKANAEVGVNYYFRNNQDQMSPRVTLLAGLDYWNDVAYADNPTQPNEQVKIAYTNSVNPYAGLQLHIPL